MLKEALPSICVYADEHNRVRSQSNDCFTVFRQQSSNISYVQCKTVYIRYIPLLFDMHLLDRREIFVYVKRAS